MNIQDLVTSLKNESLYDFEQRCKRFFHNNYEFASFDRKNRDFLIGLLKEYRNDLVNFGGIPGYKLDRKLLDIRNNLTSYGLSMLDYENIRKILKHFRR